MNTIKIISLISSIFLTSCLQAAAPAQKNQMTPEFKHILKTNDVKSLKEYVTSHPVAIQSADESQNSPLLYYIINAKPWPMPGVIQYLIENGALINTANNENELPLTKLIKSRGKNPEEIQHPSADVERKQGDILTGVKILINNGANPNVTNEPWPEPKPLMTAVQKGDSQIVELLLQAGVKPTLEHYKTAQQLANTWRRRIQQPIYLAYYIPRYENVANILKEYAKRRPTSYTFERQLIPQKTRSATGGIVREYLTGNPQSQKTYGDLMKTLRLINDELQSNNVEPLKDFIAQNPQLINSQNEAGDTVLMLAIKAKNKPAVNIIIQTLFELDKKEQKINARLAKALNIINSHGLNALKVAQATNDEEIVRLIKPQAYELLIAAPDPMVE